jgi:hypothetical protein
MGVLRHPALFVLQTLILALSLGAQSPALTPVVTAYFSERPPFCMVEGQTGTLITLTKVILSEAGIRARFIELPASRIVEMLKIGQPDALGVGWYRPIGRQPAGRFSLPFYQELPVVAVLNARMAATVGPSPRLDALLGSGFTLGLKAGNSLGPLVDQKIRAQGLVPLETVVGVPDMLKLVQAGRMDYTLLCEEEALYLLKVDPSLVPGLVLTRLADAPPGNLRSFLYPEGFDPLVADRIDAAIDKLKNSARLSAVARPLVGTPTPAPMDAPAPPKP